MAHTPPPRHDTPPLSAEPLGAEEFRLAFRNHPAGVAVITADAGGGPVGLTTTSVFSVSADPALLVFSLSTLSSSAPTIARVDTVVVHLLATRQLATAQLFATHGVDRFADRGSWSRLAAGEPYLVAAPVDPRADRQPHGSRRLPRRGRPRAAGPPRRGGRRVGPARLPQPHLARPRPALAAGAVRP